MKLSAKTYLRPDEAAQYLCISPSGEYVMRRQAAQKIGVSNMEKMNRIRTGRSGPLRGGCEPMTRLLDSWWLPPLVYWAGVATLAAMAALEIYRLYLADYAGF